MNLLPWIVLAGFVAGTVLMTWTSYRGDPVPDLSQWPGYLTAGLASGCVIAVLVYVVFGFIFPFAALILNWICALVLGAG